MDRKHQIGQTFTIPGNRLPEMDGEICRIQHKMVAKMVDSFDESILDLVRREADVAGYATVVVLNREEIMEALENQKKRREREQVYTNALIRYGDERQMTVALEELAECQKEICKILRGGEDFNHLAEEIADATIMLEQMRMMFGLNDKVCEYMDAKVARLDERLRKEAYERENNGGSVL